MGGKKPLCLAWRFEPANDTLPSSARPPLMVCKQTTFGQCMRNLDRIVHALVVAMPKPWCQVAFCSDVGT